MSEDFPASPPHERVGGVPGSALHRLQALIVREFDPGLADRLVTAAVDEALDAVVAADKPALSFAAAHAKTLHDVLGGREATGADAAYLAGRLGTLADMIGLAAQRSAAPSFHAVLAAPDNRDAVRHLMSGPARRADIAAALGVDAKAVGTSLKSLLDVGALTVVGEGSRKAYALTALALFATSGDVPTPVDRSAPDQA